MAKTKNPDVVSSRPPSLAEGDKLKTFTVSAGHKIGDNDGNPVTGGNPITLNKAQAAHLLALGAITLELPDFDDEPASADTTDKKVEGSGNSNSGGSDPSNAVPKEGTASAGGRKTSL